MQRIASVFRETNPNNAKAKKSRDTDGTKSGKTNSTIIGAGINAKNKMLFLPIFRNTRYNISVDNKSTNVYISEPTITFEKNCSMKFTIRYATPCCRRKTLVIYSFVKRNKSSSSSHCIVLGKANKSVAKKETPVIS